jgi:hypothetical protein
MGSSTLNRTFSILSPTSHRAAWIVWALALAAALVVLWRAVAGYFFLFDDFALIGVAMAQPLETLLPASLIGFYRPAGFALLWLSARFFGWETPAGFLGISILIHTINALLCFGLARTLAFDRLSAAFAGLLFLLSPWSTEGFLWVSGSFDLLATCGVLSSMLCLQQLASSRGHSRIVRVLLIAGTLLSALVAFFAKESAIVLPAFAIVWAIVIVEKGRGLIISRQILRAVLLTLVPALVYLIMRARVLGLLTGAYGEFGALFSPATLGPNLWSYARHFLLPPSPLDWSTPAVVYHITFVYPFLGALAPALLWRGIAGRPRIVLGCACCVLLALVPVAWVGLPVNSTVSSRFVYLAGVWLALGLAAALGALLDWLATQPPRRVPLLTTIVVTLFSGYFLGGLVYQAAMWRGAASLSRSVMAQMERYRGSGRRALHIVNLPQVAVEGPWILKGYAFRQYRGGVGMPPVRADLVLVRLTGGIQTVAPLGPDPFGDYQATDGRADETAVTLQLVPASPASP